MDKLAARDARCERNRYQVAAAFVFGAPLLTAAITASTGLLVKTIPLNSDFEVFLAIAIGNAALSAIGSGFGAWVEPGDRPKSRISGTIGGCVFGFLMYLMLAPIAFYLTVLLMKLFR